MHCSNIHFCTTKNGYTRDILLVTCGVTLCVMGIFLILAAYQIFPLGINALSTLCGKAMGFSILTVGVAVTSVVSMLRLARNCLNRSVTTQPTQPKSAQPLVIKNESENEADYSCEAVITRIQEASDKGLKTALFLGRVNYQPMPNEQGWIWFSLDIQMTPGNQKYHLQMDINSDAMQQLYLKFDKVVVDVSTLKCFTIQLPFKRLRYLLKNSPTSELIVESYTGVLQIGPPFINPFKGAIRLPRGQKFEDIKDQYFSEVENYLKNLFENVECKEGAYPYHAEEKIKTFYWVVSNPKTYIAE